MKSQPTVRLAVEADLSALVDLMRDFYAESNFPLDQGWAEEASAVPVGHAVLTVRYTMEHAALGGTIDDLFVRPSWRRHGVARALLSALVGEARDRGCRSLDVEVGEHNVAALALYRQFGLVPYEDGRMLLHRGLG
jgi:GNAT superfamily N-acetyltransferase